VIKIAGASLQALCEQDDQLAYGFMKRVAKATIARLNATQLQLASVLSEINGEQNPMMEAIK
jgi:hypothetical protein